MGVPGRKAAAWTRASRDRDAEIYHGYAVVLYRQALLAPGVEGMAGQAGRDLIGDESTRPQLSRNGAEGPVGRLALSALRRWQARAAGHTFATRLADFSREALPGCPVMREAHA